MTDTNDTIIPDREDTQDAYPGYTPVVDRKRCWSGPRLALIGLILIAGLVVVYFTFAAERKPDGPTLESRFQQQQQVIDQLRAQLDDLQSDQDARASAREGIASRLEEIAARVEGSERFRQDPARQGLPEQINALSQRLDELSSSVDVRFNAAQEVEQSLEASLEKIRKLQATQKASPQHSEPERQVKRRAAPLTPPFNVAGREMRGGRRYLAIASGPVGRLSDLHLIGEGQSVGGWHLTSINGHSASFTFNGQRVVVSVP